MNVASWNGAIWQNLGQGQVQGNFIESFSNSTSYIAFFLAANRIGNSCAQAIALDVDSLPADSLIALTEPEMWFKFTATSDTTMLLIGRYNEQIAALSGVYVYSGSCGNLVLLDSIIGQPVDSGWVKRLTTNAGSEYYLKVAGQLSCTGCKQWFNGWYSINLTNDDGHGGTIPPCFDNNGCALGGNMGFNQLLGAYDPIAEFPFNPRSPDYNVCNWLPANASPQISNEPPYPPSSAANDVYCARLASFDRSEIIYQNMQFTAGNTYVLRYFYRRQPTLPATVPSYVVSNQVDRLRVYLGTGINTNSIFSSIGNYPGAWGTTSLIDDVLSINSTQWTSRSVCFNPNQNFSGIAFFPSQNVPPANSFSFLNLDNMLIYRLNADAGPDRSICPGASVTLGNINNMCPVDGETFTWSPSTGLSASNVPSPVFTATSTGTFTYTLTVTDVATGCSRTDQVTVTVTGLAVAINASPQSICSGQPTTLTANVTSGQSPFTYLWSTGATVNPITVSAAGTYTVTVTDANGCTGVDEITIINAVNPPQAIVTGSTISCIDGGLNVPYSITNFDPLNTYTWASIPPPAGYNIQSPLSVSIANIITTPPAGQQINVNFPFIAGGSSNYILQVIVTDPNGCTSTTLFPVNWCCTGQGQVTSWENEIASNVNTPAPGSTVLIRGQFIVDVITVWNGLNVIMDPGAEIIVNPGVQFSILGSQLEPCESFWKSITVNNGAFLFIQRSKIDGAFTACDIKTGGGYFINDRNVFTDNYISLRVSGRSTSVRLFYDNVITRSNFMYDVYSDFIGQNPPTCQIPGDAPSHGIYLEGAGAITIGGGGASNRNLIEKTRIGIQAEYTDLLLYNTTISTLLDRPCVAPGQTSRTGVYTDVGAGHSVISANTPPLNTEIVDCNNGFFINAAVVDLFYNRILQARQGIRYLNPPSATLGIKSRIDFNEIDASWRGINMRCINPVDHHTEINGNIIQDNGNGLPGGFGVGLFVDDLPSLNRACDFNDNQITVNDGFRFGINIRNQSSFSCDDNEIDLSNATGVPVNGINIVSSSQSDIRGNTVNDLAQSTNSSGIRTLDVGGGVTLEDISCNTVTDCQRGFYFLAPMFNTLWEQNTMNAGATGLRLENGVALNLTEPWNWWCGTFSNWWVFGAGAMNTMLYTQTLSTNSNCTNRPLLTQTSGLLNYQPSFTQNPPPGACPRSLSDEPSITEIDRFIVSDSIEALYEEHMVWQYRRLLADKLAMCSPDLIATDSAISEFWYNQDNEVVQLANLMQPVLLLDSLRKQTLVAAAQITDSVQQALNQLRVNDSLLFSGLSFNDSLSILDENAYLLTRLNTWQLLLNDQYEIARTWSDSTREVFLNNYLSFNAKTDWGNTEAEIWKLLLKYGYGSGQKPNAIDSAAMADFAGLCLKTYGRPVSYIRALYSYFTNIDFDDEDGCGAGSRMANVAQSKKENQSILISPNPASDSFTIQCNLKEAGPYNLRISDAQGTLMYAQHHTDKWINLSVRDWKPGVYFVTLESSQFRHNARLVVIK